MQYLLYNTGKHQKKWKYWQEVVGAVLQISGLYSHFIPLKKTRKPLVSNGLTNINGYTNPHSRMRKDIITHK